MHVFQAIYEDIAFDAALTYQIKAELLNATIEENGNVTFTGTQNTQAKLNASHRISRAASATGPPITPLAQMSD